MTEYGHGKVILLGEHSVVHGRPALALSVERGARAEAREVQAGPTTLSIAPWGVTVDTGPELNEGRGPLQEALRKARELYEDGREFAVNAVMSVPSGAGMGSSAALGVAVLRALDAARGEPRADEEIYERSLKWERVFHGNPSGVDNAMATHGGMAVFRKNQPLTFVKPKQPISLVVGYSGTASSTKEMVASVGEQFEREPERVGKLFDDIAALVHEGQTALEKGDLKRLGELMVENQQHLRTLKLSTPDLEAMIAAAIEAGALGAKVTGAGGGGCMAALVETEAQKRAVKAALEALGRKVYEVESRA